MKKFLTTSILSLGLITSSSFALTTDSGTTANELANAMLGDGVTISNATYTGADVASGLFEDGAAIGFESGIMLGSGDIANAVGPNVSDGITTSTP